MEQELERLEREQVRERGQVREREREQVRERERELEREQGRIKLLLTKEQL